MSDLPAQVEGGQTTGVEGAAQAAAPSTPSTAGVAQTTPGQAPSTQAQPPVVRPVTQADLNALKSSLQRDADRRLRENDAQWQQRTQQLQAQLNEAATRGMTDAQRAEYQQAQQQQYYQQVQQQNAQYQQMLADQQNRQQYIAYYVQTLGVPMSELNLTGTTEELNASGWQYIQAEMARLRGQQTAGGAPAVPEGPPQVPEVVTGQATPAGPMTWPDLMKATGMTQEQIYRAVEVGQLSPDVLPR